MSNTENGRPSGGLRERLREVEAMEARRMIAPALQETKAVVEHLEDVATGTARLHEHAHQALRRFERGLQVKIWGGALLIGILSAALIVLTLTLLRPGWTLTEHQREAIEAAENTRARYQAMSEEERAVFRELMGLPAPMESPSEENAGSQP